MPLYLTASHSSRITKPGSKTSASRRSSSSRFSNLSRRKPNRQTKSVDDVKADSSNGGDDEKLDDTGKVISLAAISSANNVLQAVKHSHELMFCDVPERAGMNSTRIAEVLNFRKGLPAIVSLAHIHGLITASTRTEREIGGLIVAGDLRRVTLSGRGNDISGLSEFLIPTQDLKERIRKSPLDSSVADKFLGLLGQQPQSTTLSSSLLSPGEVTALRNAGFLVSSGISRKSSATATVAGRLTPATISRQASGTVAAVGGEGALESLGGIGNARGGNSESVTSGPSMELTLSLPNIGTYLHLLSDARTHLVELLGKSKYREAPLYLLRERWDGAIESENKVSTAKRIRGEFSGILPGKTKKWKQFYGLSFDWILEECLGAGLVELFDTSSVGHGVRIL